MVKQGSTAISNSPNVSTAVQFEIAPMYSVLFSYNIIPSQNKNIVEVFN
jgi:hypothetical protein